ncbi:gliding motility-associated C-terminal domain-containing protein [Chitinophaga rupis]|uniref:Gliding motility-associated C-terminal domain-containing protein n=1 Tax=Chitinophaga rupis TaxID=573321 RepID=A0A1H7QQP6_9BACT|nr:gliding motility-associated C-terminal domain-containing protein [Chitinophaga rupis]SEL50253.1 gliding motility-associated C-terminal domain-containing protein [Chitinophaga rupis]
MRISLALVSTVLCCLLTHTYVQAQTSFTAPNTVYVNDPVNITNTTTGATTYFWNFCSGSLYNAPQVTNFGNPGGQLSTPVFLATAKDGTDYYAFVANHNGTLLKYMFGSSLLNTPTIQNLGTVGGTVPTFTEGVQIAQDASGWHVVIVGGDPANSTIARIDFGPSLSNASPTGINFGNIGAMNVPHDLFMIQEGSTWYGFTVNAGDHTITRFDFGTSFTAAPVGVNLGNVGNLSQPTGVCAIQDNGNRYIFVTNQTGSLSRLDFGASFSNTPTGVNIGGLNFLQAPRDISVIHDCGKAFGLVMDAGRAEVVRIDFNTGITGTPTATGTGVNGFQFLHSISSAFRENNNLYAFVLDAYANSLSRIVFASCTNASVPSSTLQQPLSYSYNAPGTYTINLITDEGLATQGAFCKTIEVLPRPITPAAASFTAPDTVCVNAPVNITNTSTNASTYYWNFCSGSLYNAPQITNLGGMGGNLDRPVFIATAKEGNNYYGFVTNNGLNNLIRLDFGTSLLNTPTPTNLGNFGNIIPINTEGVQIVQDADGWHIIILGGINSNAKIVKVDLGTSLANPSPTATDWGNIGNLNYPADLYTFQEGSHWYGLTVNAYNNTITRFDFGTSFQNPPAGTNLGNLGNLDFPTGIFTLQESGNWYVLITNRNNNSLTRLDFGASLLNTPAAVNLGNPDGVLNQPRDLCVLHDCGRTYALAVNEVTSDLLRIDFQGSITGAVSGVSLGSSGGMSFPHSISTLFREGNGLYAFVTNVDNNTISRLVFSGCNNASIPSSTLQQPPAISYNTPGTYTINLLADELLPSPSVFCKTIVVMAPPVVNLGTDQTVCDGTDVELDAGAGAGLRYQWSTGAGTQKITVNQSGTYSVTVNNGGCTTQDDIVVNMSKVMQLNPVVTAIDCNRPTGSIVLTPTGGTQPYSYYLDASGPVSSNTFDNLQAGNYTVRVQDQLGCEVSQPVTVSVDPNRILNTTGSMMMPSCAGVADGMISVQVQQGVPPFEYAINGAPYQTGNTFNNLGGGAYTVYTNNGVCIDSFLVTLIDPVAVALQVTKEDELCRRQNGSADIRLNGGTPPYDVYWNSAPVNSTLMNNLGEGDYTLQVTDARGCTADTTIRINNLDLPPVTILNKDITINIGESIQLVAVNAPDYIWTPAEGLSCTNCAAPVAQPMHPTRYIVSTVTGKNCVPADTVNILLSYNLSVYVPNAFTPNGDGKNDVFRPKVKGASSYHLQIYNRWGQLLYDTFDMKTGWDGRYRDVLQPMGAYVYMVQYAYYGSEKNVLMQKGTFTLIR